VVAFIGAAGLADKVTLETDSEENREYIQKVAGKVGFPALETEPDKVMLESTDIIDFLAKESDVDTEKLPLYDFLMEGVLKNYSILSRHVREREGAEAYLAIIKAGRGETGRGGK
jgi:glutaredoxin 2